MHVVPVWNYFEMSAKNCLNYSSKFDPSFCGYVYRYALFPFAADGHRVTLQATTNILGKNRPPTVEGDGGRDRAQRKRSRGLVYAGTTVERRDG